MRALLFENGQARVAEVKAPKSELGSARVQMCFAGVCATDLAVLEGYASFAGILGHEGLGVVVEGPDEWVGTLVALEINVACGRCASCVSGRRKHCEQRRVLGIREFPGVFAEEIVVPVDNLVRVPADLDPLAAVLAEPLAAALEGVKQLPAGGEVAIVGDGRLGILSAMALKAEGRDFAMIGRHPERWNRFDLGLKSPRPEDRFMGVIDTSGTALGFEVAISRLRPGGRLVLKSTMAVPQIVDLTKVVVNELEIVGSRCGDLSAALDAMSQGRITPRPLVEHVVPLGKQGLELARHSLKVVFDFEASLAPRMRSV